MTPPASPRELRGGALALNVALAALVLVAWPNLSGSEDARGGRTRSGGAAGWTASVDSVKLPIKGRNSSTYQRGYIVVRAVSKNGTPLQGVEIRSRCRGYWQWNQDVTGRDGRAWIASHCGPASPNASVDIKLTYNNESATFSATTGHRHFVTLRNNRGPVTLEGRLKWKGTQRPITGTLEVWDGDGNRDRLSLDSQGRFREELPAGIDRGEKVAVEIHESHVQGWNPKCPGGSPCKAIPKDGDWGTVGISLPTITVDADVMWRGSRNRVAGTVAVVLDGDTIGTEKNTLAEGRSFEVETGTPLLKARTVDVEFTPSLVPGLTYRRTVTVKPPNVFGKNVEMRVTPPEIVVTGAVVDKHSEGKPVQADVAVKTTHEDVPANRSTTSIAANTTSSRTDGSFTLIVKRWSDPVTQIRVVPEPRLYPSLHPRTYGHAFWLNNLRALTSTRDASNPTVVAPGKKATFRMTKLALELSGKIKPMAVEGRLRWKKERLRDQVGNESVRRSHSFQDSYPLGRMDVYEIGTPRVSRTAGGSFRTTASYTQVGSTNLDSDDDGRFRVEFGDFYGSRTVRLAFTPASLSGLVYRSKPIRVKRGTQIQREISHPKLNLHGSVRDPDGCAVPATVTFYPKIPGNQKWHQSFTSSSHLDRRGQNFSATVEHVPIRKVVVEPTVNYLQTKTFTGREWRKRLQQSVSSWNPAQPDTVEMSARRRPSYLVRYFDVELDYVRPSVGPTGPSGDVGFGWAPGQPVDEGAGENQVDRQPDLDRDGVPGVVEQHLADVHTPSYEFDRNQSELPGDLASYLRHSSLVTPKGAGASGRARILGTGYFLKNRMATPTLTNPGPVYVRVMKLDAAVLEDATYRIAYGLWYDRGRHGPGYLPASAGRAFHGDFKEVLVDVRRGEVQQVFLRNYGHDGVGERTIAGIPFDLAANSYTYGPGGVKRRRYDPLVESDELQRLQWETRRRFQGDRRPQYFRVYVAAGTHNQFLRAGKTFIRPKAVTLDDDAARKVQRAVFGTTSFVPQVHLGGGAPAARRGTASVAIRPEVELLGAPPVTGRRLASGSWPTGSVSKPTGGDIGRSLVTFPGHWGQDSAVVNFSDRKPATLWLSTAGPDPMRYDTVNRLGDAPDEARPGAPVSSDALRRAARRARSGGTLFGHGHSGNLGGSGAGASGSGAGATPPGGASNKVDHLYAWSGDATFQYVVGTCITAANCSFPGGGRRTGAAPGGRSAAASTPEIGGEASGYAQDYPASGDAYMDAGFYAHAMGKEAKFLRVTSVRQTPAGGGTATTATTIRWNGALRTFSSLPPGTYLSYGLVSADVGISLLGFEIGSEVSASANLDRPKVKNQGGGRKRARVLDASLGGSWSIVQVGFDPDFPGAPSATLSPIQVKRPDIFRGVLNVKASPSSLSSWVELSANFKAAVGVGSGVSMGGFGMGSGFTYIDIVDYTLAETRFRLLR